MNWSWAGKALSQLDVRAVVYHVSATTISALVINPDGTTQPDILGQIDEFLPVIDAVADGLQRTMNVARGNVGALREFAARSGRALLPPSIRADPPDVLVIVPHSVLHAMPLHLVHTDSGEPLCAVTGVTYAGSMSQFVQCAGGNPVRCGAEVSRLFSLESRSSERKVAGYCADVLDWHGTRFAAVMERVESALGHPVIPEGSRDSVKGHLDSWNPHAPHLDALVMVAHGYLDLDAHQFSGLLLASTEKMIPGFRGGTLRPLTLMKDQPPLWFPEAPMTLPPPDLKIARFAEVLSIAEMRMDTLSRIPLVALFGCSAGWSRVLKGDVPSSFGNALLTLGSSTVIAPAWDAEVTATAQWAGHFFTAWSRFGWPAALSGAYATRALYEDSVPMEHYGALTLRGDWL